MDLPELHLAIAPHLGERDLGSCALVCRSWNVSFSPFLYQEINLWNSKSLGVLRHCAHARNLQLVMSNPVVEHLGLVTRLKEMNVTGSWGQSRAVSPAWIALLQQNPGVEKLIVRKMLPHIMEKFVSLCPNIDELIIYEHQFRLELPSEDTHNEGSSFWRTCQGQTKLRLHFNDYPTPPGQLSDPPQEKLPSMRQLTIGPSRSALLDQMRLICACPNLETLEWNLSITDCGVPDYHLNLFKNGFKMLPHLRELDFSAPSEMAGFESNWTRNMLGVLPLLKGFRDIQNDQFELGLVEGPLSRHFGTLVNLDIRWWNGVTSEGNHLILTSCPSLQIFESKSYEIGQISALNGVTLVPDTHVKTGSGPLGWVCTHLSEIGLEFAHETPEKSRLMFDQLCCMRNLRKVFLTGPQPGLVPMYIRWDDETSARFWGNGILLSENLSPWMRTVWPKIFNFCTYLERMVLTLQFRGE